MNYVHTDGPYNLRLESIKSKWFPLNTRNNKPEEEVVEVDSKETHTESNVDIVCKRIEKALTIDGFVDSMTRRLKWMVENISVTTKSLSGRDTSLSSEWKTHELQSKIDNVWSKVLSLVHKWDSNFAWENNIQASLTEIWNS